jgi:hypothetical protein
VRPELVAFALAAIACGDGHLRGSVSPSPDEHTYLAIVDDGGCDVLIVDGVVWRHGRARVRIAPGEHRIACGEGDSGIGFFVPEGVVFGFDYWGP